MTNNTDTSDIATAINIDADRHAIRSCSDFARQAAKAEFGPRNYADPDTANFIDRLPNWQRLGDVASQVLNKTAGKMALQDVLRSPKKGEAA